MTNKEMLSRSLMIWRNYLQTGDVNLSTESAIQYGWKDKCKQLNSDQQEFIIRLEELQKEILKSKKKITIDIKG
tara:strand:- start:15364 stop:15585 length:222 start_codon:yes stop_codon:yes gene_type:complete